MKTPNPTKFAEKHVARLKKDVFAIMWIIFIATLIIMTLYFKQYVKDMIVISLVFLIAWYMDDYVYCNHRTSITTFLSRGQRVPSWKRFPLFFLEIVVLYGVYIFLENALNYAFPAQAINFVLVLLWVGFLFLIWIYKFSKET